MNPHRLGWGFANELPFAAVIGLVTVVAMVFSRESKRIPITPVTILLMLFILWMAITTFFATNPDMAYEQLDKVLKIQLMIFFTLILITDRHRLHILVWVIVISLGFYGVKGGVFTLMTGGQFHVIGPKGTFIEGNTSLALALIMILPLMRYLQLQAENKWVKRGLSAAMMLTGVSILGSYSRGALLAGAAIAIFMILKSRKRAVLILMMLVLIPVLIIFMPEKWMGRMETIQTYQQDSSAMGRIEAWQFAANIASQRFLGGGFECFTPGNYHIYAPKLANTIAQRSDARYQGAHSIYFQVLGNHGFIGLILFLILGILSWRTGSWIIRCAKDDKNIAWARDLASMVQVSMIGYAVGGAFLGLAYYDLFYHLIAILVLIKLILIREQQEESDTLSNKNIQRRNGRLQQNITSMEASNLVVSIDNVSS